MAAYAWGRARRWSPGAPPLATLPTQGTRPATLSDAERAAYERLAPAGWWHWANRGRLEPLHPWEAGG